MDSAGGVATHWASVAYHGIAPKVGVRGRMALILFFVVAWALSWLLWRMYTVVQTPNEILVEKLGLDIPSAPIVTLEEIGPREIQLAWKHNDTQNSIQWHSVEVNGAVAGETKKTETSASILNLVPGTLYDIRVFTISATGFKTPSSLLRVRTTPSSQASSQDEFSDGTPVVRGYASRGSTAVAQSTSIAMARDLSTGQPQARRGTNSKKISPLPSTQDIQAESNNDVNAQAGEKSDAGLAQLSERFKKLQQDIEMVDDQIIEEEREHETALRELERKRDELKQGLKERDEASSELRKQVHKMETASRTAQSERTKKERQLQQEQNLQKKRKEEIARWEDQISTMADEMAGIETQKAAIEKRTKSEVYEIRRKIEEEKKEVGLLDEENKEKALQIKALEEERRNLNAENETDESREADRLEHEKDRRWRDKAANLEMAYRSLYGALHQAQQQHDFARERLNWHENARRATAVSFAPMPALDIDPLPRGVNPTHRGRNRSSLASSMSSPKTNFTGETFVNTTAGYNNTSNVSPTFGGPNYLNVANGMTFNPPGGSPSASVNEFDLTGGAPMSPRADALLPSNLLGDESADDMEGDTTMPTKPTATDPTYSPFPRIGPPSIPEEEVGRYSPSLLSSSSRSFSSPRESFANMVDPDNRSIQSGQKPSEAAEADDQTQTNSRKLMSNLFSFNRQRGKTLADQPPVLGSLKQGQSQSFPRDFGEELDPLGHRRKRLSYGGNWAFPANLMTRTSSKEQAPTRPPSSRRALPNLFSGFGKSSSPAPYDPFAARSGSLDPEMRVESSSSRPASVYSFDKLPRPSIESQFRAWGPERSNLRGSPLVPDWGSSYSWSRSQSRRPSIHVGSTSNLSMGAQADEDFLESAETERPLQAPIGTRPASSQRPSTPKLNPAAPAFTTLFGRRADKSKDKDKPKAKDIPRSHNSFVPDDGSPPDSRKSKDTQSMTATISTAESRESLERTSSAHSAGTPSENTPQRPTFISKITRKASSNKFGSWKEKGSLFSRDRDRRATGEQPSTPTGELDEDATSVDQQLGKSVESTSTTPSGEEKKASRASLTWSFMRKSKKGGLAGPGGREDLAASEVSESSERASEVGDYFDDGESGV